MAATRSVIVGTGSCIPSLRVPNDHFLEHSFSDANQKVFDRSNAEILEQFAAITGIRERRYVEDGVVTSDIAATAAKRALESSGIDPETLDGLIVAHNFGDVRADNRRSDMVPSIAARVKRRLGIANPGSVAFDLIFGCPGWLQGMIQAHAMIRCGDAKRVMVIGAETLSRVSDPHDRDSLIYSDGAGATIVEGVESSAEIGILSHSARSDAVDYCDMLLMGSSNSASIDPRELFLKMQGRKLYKYAVQTVPAAIKECIDKAGRTLADVRKILIHQANEKMDEAIVAKLYELYGMHPAPPRVMPMTISWLGNSSVATIPTLLDLLLRGEVEHHELQSGDTLVFASVGAGMNVNAFLYTIP